MSEYIHLIGSERVENAGHTMSNAAEEMKSAARSFNETCEAQRRYMDEWIGRFEYAIESLKGPPPKTPQEERLEMAKALGVDNDPTASTHVTS